MEHYGISEEFLDKFSCTRTLLAGTMYITENFVCWNTLLIGMDKRVVIKINDIAKLSKSTLGGISIETLDKGDYTFANFTPGGRSNAYEMILRQAKKANAPVWRAMNMKLDKKLDSIEKKEDKQKVKEDKKDMKRKKKAYKRGEIPADEYYVDSLEAKIEKEGGLGSISGPALELKQHPCSYQLTLSSQKGILSANEKGIRFDASDPSKQFTIPYDEITSIKKKRHVMKGDVVEIHTLATDYLFNGFMARDDTVKELKAAWRLNRKG